MIALTVEWPNRDLARAQFPSARFIPRTARPLTVTRARTAINRAVFSRILRHSGWKLEHTLKHLQGEARMAAYEDWNRIDDDEDEELQDTSVSDIRGIGQMY